MKSIIFLCSLIALFSTSCNPTVYQLMQYEHTEYLKKDTLYIILYTNNEELRLLDKYNQNKRSERLKEQAAETNQSVIAAFENEYHFSHFVAWNMDENDFRLPNGHYTNFQLYYESVGDNREQAKLALTIKSPDHKNVATVTGNFSTHPSVYRYLVKQMNKKLSKIYDKGIKLQEG